MAQALEAQGQGRGGNGRQALRHRGDGQSQGVLQHRQGWVAAQQPDAHEEAAGGQAAESQLAAELIEILLDRCRWPHRVHGEPLHLGQHAGAAGGGRHNDSLAAGHQSAGVQHVGAAAKRRVRLEQGLRLFADGNALSGESRLVDAEIACLQQAGIGRHVQTRVQHIDVARDELCAGQRTVLAITPGERLLRPLLHQAGDGALGAHFGDVADRGVGGDHDQRGGGIDQAAGRRRDHGRDDQDTDRQARHLLAQHLERGASLALGQAVRSVVQEPGFCLRQRQALCRRDLEVGQHLVGAHGVPGGHVGLLQRFACRR